MKNKLTKGLLYLAITLTVVAIVLFTGGHFMGHADRTILGISSPQYTGLNIAQYSTWIGISTWIAFVIALVIERRNNKK